MYVVTSSFWLHITATTFLLLALWTLAHHIASECRSFHGRLVAGLLGVTAILAMVKIYARYQGIWLDPTWILLKFFLGASLWGVIYSLNKGGGNGSE